MTSTIVTLNARFGKKPPVLTQYNQNPNRVAIKGDGHGNWHNILVDMQIHGFVTLTDEELNYFDAFYLKPLKALTRADIEEFWSKIKAMKFENGGSYKLAGDLTADRGDGDQCDAFMLILIHEMVENGIRIESAPQLTGITISNHCQTFIEAWSRNFAFDTTWSDRTPGNRCSDIYYVSDITVNGQDNSLQALGYLLENNLFTLDDLNIVLPSYLKLLKLIDYLMPPDKQSIALLTHAPCPIGKDQEECQKAQEEHRKELIGQYQKIATYIGVSGFDDSTPISLARSIDVMNEQYQELLGDKDRRVIDIDKDSPLFRLIWSRWGSRDKAERLTKEEKNQIKATHNGYPVYYIHGHDGPISVPRDKRDFVISLDSIYAKSFSSYWEDLIVFSWDGDALEFQKINAKQDSHTFLGMLHSYIKQKNIKEFKKTLNTLSSEEGYFDKIDLEWLFDKARTIEHVETTNIVTAFYNKNIEHLNQCKVLVLYENGEVNLSNNRADALLQDTRENAVTNEADKANSKENTDLLAKQRENTPADKSEKRKPISLNNECIPNKTQNDSEQKTPLLKSKPEGVFFNKVRTPIVAATTVSCAIVSATLMYKFGVCALTIGIASVYLPPVAALVAATILAIGAALASAAAGGLLLYGLYRGYKGCTSVPDVQNETSPTLT
ncbi:MAG: hypothetical protein K2Q14_01140 [Gammaproteobacteria bacterium]|nr:hypothetical protein [Gammaproteobacteria bacterium]